ncbi:hypothetical protein Pta02_68100 [Planobispora takensis]|uniref:Uncharacterized protein n=1 Tax=Planobispora takensis TaxID=1367882 RepID=A0A8J3T2B3_9ACTN|nr:hypothetical protein Pta02_68100 [Planobispora takensis]
MRIRAISRPVRRGPLGLLEREDTFGTAPPFPPEDPPADPASGDPGGPACGPSDGPFRGRTGLVPDRALPYTCETALGTVSSRTAPPEEEAWSGTPACGPAAAEPRRPGAPPCPGACPGTGWAGCPAARGGTDAGDRSARVRSSSSCQSPTSHLRHFSGPHTN